MTRNPGEPGITGPPEAPGSQGDVGFSGAPGPLGNLNKWIAS